MARGRPAKANHGDYGYARRHKCPCEPCRAGVSRYQKKYNYDRARGISRRLPAEPVRRHIQSLLDQGIYEHQISAAAGLSHTMVKNTMRGVMGKPRPEMLLRPTVEKILGVTYEKAAAVPTRVSSIGVIRRVQALEYLGIPKSVMAKQLGVSESMVHQYVSQPEVLTSTRDAVHAMYVALRDTPGTLEYTRWRAYRRDFKPPMSWDDETIDDPETVPHPAACVVAQCTRPAHKWSCCKWHQREIYQMNGASGRKYKKTVQRLGQRRPNNMPRTVREIADLRALQVSDADIAKHLGITLDYIQKLEKIA